MSKLPHSKSGRSQSSAKNAKFLLLLLALAEFQHADRKNGKGKSIKSRVDLAQNEEPKFKSSGLSSFSRTKHNTHIQYTLSHLYIYIIYNINIYIYNNIIIYIYISCFFSRHQSNPKHELDILGQGAHFILHFAEVLGRFALAEHLGLPRHRRAAEVGSR
jgi:hypothetical protein